MAAVGPVPGVQPLVGLQAVGVPQRLPAVAAEEASPRVGEHVAAQLRLLGEALLALGAGEGLVSVVDPQVGLQVPWGGRGAGPPAVRWASQRSGIRLDSQESIKSADALRKWL